MFPSIFLYFLIDDDKFPPKFSRFSNNIINSKFHFQIDWKREKEKKTVENPRPIKQHLLSRRKKKAMQIVQIFHLISFADSTGGQTISLRDIHGQWIDLLEEQEGGGWWARNFKIQMGRATAPPPPPPVVVVVYGIVTANWIGRVARGRRGDGIDIIPGSLLTYE